MGNNSNRAPALKWWAFDLANGVRRQHLYLNGKATPYFIDAAKHIHHRTCGERYGLYGSGMHRSGCAAILDFGPRVATLKHKAEQMALASLENAA